MQNTEPMVREPVASQRPTTHPGSNRNKPMLRRDIEVLAVLAIVVAVAFSGVLGHQFLLYDDDVYVTGNPIVRDGFTWPGIKWSLDATRAANWHPLTWMSHMIDSEIYGLNPRGHHFTNLGFHVANTCILFVLLRWTTGRLWTSALAAALFAVHPLRVESVAWVAERKDLLSTFFGLLTIAAYVWYCRGSQAWWRYALAMVLFALSLMSKPMLVTLPFVLLLLDWWPLNRLRAGDSEPRWPQTLLRLSVEKLPLLALSAISSYVTLRVQRSGGAVSPLETVPVGVRIENAMVACMQYLERTLWPNDLSFVYPHSLTGFPTAEVVTAGAVLLILSATAVAVARRLPYVPVGWFWFLGSLVPILGLVQVGLQSTADRYTYWPQIGLAILLSWALAEFATRFRIPQVFRIAFCVAVIGFFSITTWRQVAVWHDTLALTDHALEIDPENTIAMTVRGQTLSAAGRYDEAIAMYEAVLDTPSPLAMAHAPETRTLLAAALLSTGEIDQAADLAAQSVVEKPALAMSRLTLGTALMEQQRFEEAREELEIALRIDPLSAAGHSNLANVLLELGDITGAIRHGRRSVRLSSALVPAHYTLGRAYAAKGDFPSAVAHLQVGLQEGPQWPLVARELAWLHATCAAPEYRDTKTAIQLATEADRRTRHQIPKFLDTLATAYAAAEQWPAAVETEELAIRLATEQGETKLLAAMRQRLNNFRNELAWIEPVPVNN